MPSVPRHPAKFSQTVLGAITPILWERFGAPEGDGARVLDPFAGTGGVHRLGYRSVGVEIEPEWARAHPRTIVGDALELPFPNASFDALCTSPCYGNRMADAFRVGAKGGDPDATKRHSYALDLGRPLTTGNAGSLQWGDAYRAFHLAAWAECARVVRPAGVALVNVSDHVRNHELVPVVDWHAAALGRTGWRLVEQVAVKTPRLGHGAHRDARADCEYVLVAERAA